MEKEIKDDSGTKPRNNQVSLERDRAGAEVKQARTLSSLSVTPS